MCGSVLVAERLEDRLLFAEGLMRRQMFTQALTEYEALRKSTPPTDKTRWAEITFRLAECYDKLGRVDDARKAWGEVSSQGEGDLGAAAKLRLSALFLEKGEAEQARTLIESALVAKGLSADLTATAKLQQAQCYEQLGRTQDAVKVYTLLSRQGGRYAQHAKLALAALAVKEGRYAEARTAYQELLNAESDEARKRDIALPALAAAYKNKDYATVLSCAQVIGAPALAKQKLLLPVAFAALRAGRPEDAQLWLSVASTSTRAPKTPAHLLLEGSVAEALGNTQGALTAYERLLSEYPKADEAPQAAEAMLILRSRSGDPKAFLSAFKRVSVHLSEASLIALSPYRLDAAIQAQDLGQARAVATWLIAHAPEAQASEASYRLGTIEQKENRWDVAGETWLRTAQTWKTSPIAQRAAYAAAYAFTQAKQDDRAEVALRLALSGSDASITANALILKAKREVARGDTAGATQSLDEYLSRFPQGEAFAEAAYLRGLLAFNAQAFKDADTLLQKALTAPTQSSAIRPLDHAQKTDATLRRAQALYALKQFDEAATLLQPLLESSALQSLAPAYLRWLAEFRIERKEWTRADEASRALDAHPQAQSSDHVAAKTLLGLSAEAQGNAATALSAYESALQGAPDSASPYLAKAALGVGRLYSARKAYDKARPAFEKAIEHTSTASAQERLIRAQAYAGLATACNALGDLDTALRADMNLIIFFEDQELVPAAFDDALAILEKQGRTQEAQTLKTEKAKRYNTSAPASKAE